MTQSSGARTIGGFLTMATNALVDAHIPSAKLDSELLLVSIINQSREYLLAHDDQPLSQADWAQACYLLAQRIQRVPVAYLTGHKEFYNRNFLVTPNVLIPRPESEQLIESLAKIIAHDDSVKQIADIGTGSGCLAITAKLEHPQLIVTASDTSAAALTVAKDNAVNLNTNVAFIKSDLLAQYPIDQPLDAIIANLPYVSKNWDGLANYPELYREPAEALFASDNGCDLIKKLIFTAPLYLRHKGYLLLELDTRQLTDISVFANDHGFTVIDQKPFTLVLQLDRKSDC
ncbi:MAG: peptide chain release factor N(5)-glutamine methyltransferase [Candidatus Saccharibacteria bacterium]|nr:peptide chain release factor N(5)-glutamine methyltransferase [Candidatus Saccharibacteria bacterium]